jgi:phospholipid/cholesterol/gamma-HCH transport system ATP-binding protein
VPEPLIALRKVCKAYGNTVIFEDADLEIHAGETLTIMGVSGCGKSIVLKMIVGLEAPDSGDIFIEGRNVCEMKADELRRLRRKVAFVFQRDALFDSMSVLENVTYALREHTDMSSDEMRERAVDFLGRVDLGPETLEVMPADLSGGMRKRVALARSVALEPEITLYDEPMEGLDPQSVTRVRNMIVKLQSRPGVTTVLATHHMKTAFSISDRLALIHDHRFAHIGTPDQFRASESPEVMEFVRGPSGSADRLDME